MVANFLISATGSKGIESELPYSTATFVFPFASSSSSLPHCVALTVTPGRSKPVADLNILGFCDLPPTFTTGHISSCGEHTNLPAVSLECQFKTRCCVPW